MPLSLPALAWAPPSLTGKPASSRARSILLLLIGVTLLVWSTVYLLNLYSTLEPYPPYPHTPHTLNHHAHYKHGKGRPHYPPSSVSSYGWRNQQQWLDPVRLTRTVNMTHVVNQPGREWDMFLDPVPELLTAPGPSTHICEDDDSFGPMLFIGVFSTAREWRQREVIRALQSPLEQPSEKVEMKFILGLSSDPELQKRAEREAELYGDLVFLDVGENMDEGKTYAYFRWVSQRERGERPRFVLKSDSDTFLLLPLVLHTLSHLPCRLPTYWGTTYGSCLHSCYPLYTRGLAYGLSWPLVSWLGSANLSTPGPYTGGGFEDARTGAWLGSLPKGEEEVVVVDLGWHAGDWDGRTVPWDGGTVALHAMKTPELYARVASTLREMWAKSGREWRWPPFGTYWSYD